DPTGVDVEARPVERMRHLADQAANRVARQLGVGIERYDVANISRRGARLLSRRQKSRVIGAAQKSVQLMQLAALALPTDPFRLAFVPNAPAMEQQEAGAAGGRAIALVELGNACHGGLQESRVAIRVLGRGI